MKYVIDATVGFKWGVVEPHSDKACKLRDDFGQGIHELHAPDLFPTEVANGRLLVAERRKRILPGQGAILLADIMKTPPILHASASSLLHRAYAIAAASLASVYDCLYVALAEAEQCELVTADDKLVRNFQQQFPFVISLRRYRDTCAPTFKMYPTTLTGSSSPSRNVLISRSHCFPRFYLARQCVLAVHA